MTFQHRINVRTLPRKGRVEEHAATEAEREEIAAEAGVASIERMTFRADVTPWRKGGVTVKGKIEGSLTQECVVTLDPVREEIDETFEARFVPEGSKLERPIEAPDGELVLDAEGEDMPETFAGDSIDLADVWLEFLVLALDPFPRKPGVELPEIDEDREQSPFAALEGLRGKLN